MEAMKNAAMYNINSAGVEQSKAAYAQVMASIPEIEQSIPRSGKFLYQLFLEKLPAISNAVPSKSKFYHPNFQ
jgi:hypothetical protein